MRKVWLAAIGAAAFATTGGPAAEANDGVNCDTAHADIVYLEHEKKSTLERVAKGVSSVMPIGLVMHTATGTEDDSIAIATGDYNKRIDMRIAEIKDACGID